MKTHALTLAFAATLAAAPASAADAGASPVESSTTSAIGPIIDSGSTNWTTITGEVVDVDRTNNTIRIRETAGGPVRDISVTPDVTIQNASRSDVQLKSVKKGQTVTLRSGAGATGTGTTGTGATETGSTGTGTTGTGTTGTGSTGTTDGGTGSSGTGTAR